MEAARTPHPERAIDGESVDRPDGVASEPAPDGAADEQVCDDQLVEGLVEDRAGPEDAGEAMPNDDEPLDDDEGNLDDGADEEGEGDAMTEMDSVVEAILFAADEPLTASRLVSVVEAGSTRQVRRSVKNLNKKYARANCAFRIEEIAGGYQMMTLPAYNPWLRKLLRVRTDNKLTQAALETLAIVAYKQPLIRADIEAIRGVASGEVIRNLMYKGLVKIVGRAEVLGRPMLYGTTRRFLDVFGLSSLKDLPNVEELKKPD